MGRQLVFEFYSPADKLAFEHYSGQHDIPVQECTKCYRPTETKEGEFNLPKKLSKELSLAIDEIENVQAEMQRDSIVSPFVESYCERLRNAINTLDELLFTK